MGFRNQNTFISLENYEKICDNEILHVDNLERIVYIRNQGHTVVECINRQLCHYSYPYRENRFIR